MNLEPLNERNTVTVECALREIEARIWGQQQRIDGLVNTISTLVERMDFVEQLMAAEKVKAVGHGPTIR